MNDSEILKKMNDAKDFTLKDQSKYCKVIDVYDGDTVTIIFRFENEFYKKKMRLNGIDTPEIRTKDIKEKRIAKEAKNYLSELINNKIVWIKFDDWDKYGRLLGTIYLDNTEKENVNEKLIKSGYAYKYTGGKKLKFTDWYIQE